MGLGEASLAVFFDIVQIALLMSVVLTAIVRLFRRIHFGKLLLLGFTLWLAFTYTGTQFFHYDRFVELHQSHNDYVPATGCLTYEPSFGHLFASYSMTRAEFNAWVEQFPVPMSKYDSQLQRFDEERLGFTDPDAAFATESASNGAQTRVYFKDGTMYLSRNVM
jgi:hypothetical protein